MTDPIENQQDPADQASAAASAEAATQEQVNDAASAEAAQQPAESDPFAAGVAEAVHDDGEATAAAAPAADAQPAADAGGDQPPPAADAAAQPAQDQQPAATGKTADEEIADLGITNERTQQRFRELSARAAEVEPLRLKAARADEWEQTVSGTGATPQQFGNALGYLAAINSGDPEKMNAAYESMVKEMQWLGQKLGREALGFDPLSAHSDLAEKVKSGDLPREVAAEIAQHRQRGAMVAEHQASQSQAQQAQMAQVHGLQQVEALGQQLRAADPAFAQKMAYLMPTIEVIQSTMPPQQWAQAVHHAYQRLPAIAAPAPAPAQPPRLPNNPTRASASPALAAKPTSENAFEFGVAEARAAGR